MKKYLFLWLILLPSMFIFGQETYNNCAEAFELCPNSSYTLNNIDANSTFCNNCEDDFEFCFSGENTIWMKFNTNDFGGEVNVDFSNLVFENNPGQGNALQAAIIEATVPCVSSSYSLISNCVADTATNFTLSAGGLNANTTYYVVVNGAKDSLETVNAEATFDVITSGTSVDRDPKLIIGTATTNICRGNNVVFNATVVDCDSQQVFNWYINGELVGVTVDPIFEYHELIDNDVVSAQVVCINECQDSISNTPLNSNHISFTVFDFLVDAGPDFEIQEGEGVQLQGQTDEINVTWSPAFNMNDPTLITPVVGPDETTTYFLTVGNGICTITDEMTVFVKEDLEIPNTFSPNGDGVNDIWEIKGISNFPDCGVKVFTRWGQLVFQTTGYSLDDRWDGTSKSGKDLAPGAYYYVIQLRDVNDRKPIKGTVSIVK